MKKFICSVCGYVHEGDSAPEKCPLCKVGADKYRIAKRAKELNLDAIHDTVHEMSKDEARHGKGFEGLFNRYFK